MGIRMFCIGSVHWVWLRVVGVQASAGLRWHRVGGFLILWRHVGDTLTGLVEEEFKKKMCVEVVRKNIRMLIYVAGGS